VALTEEGIIEVEGMLSRWVRLPSGARAHYMTSGTTGPAVVLLHGGLPGSSGTAGWRFMAPYLGARGFRVYCPDMPAFGLSDQRNEHWPTGIDSFVDFVAEFVDTLCLDKFHLAGNSMGCVNSVNYMVAHPERVLSFALIAGDIGDLIPEGLEKPKPSVTIRPYDGTKESMRNLMETIIHRGGAISDDLVEMRQAAASRHREAHAQFWPTLLQYGRRAPWENPNLEAKLSTKGRLDRLQIPGIYLYGRQDVLIPVEWGFEQEKVLPDVQFFYPDEAGHQGQTDQPEIFNRVFHEFFSMGKVSRATADAAGVSTNRLELSHLVEQV
jgi:2-hydroxy-6-oxonona-2,4-dienedioate hydrolase